MAQAPHATPNIALYGRSGSGKSTVAQFLVTQHGYQHAKTGAACRNLCRELFGSESKSLMNEVTDALKRIDDSVWLRAGLAGLRDDSPNVFDSMRFKGDYKFFYAHAYVLVHIRAPAELRASRLGGRGQPFDPSIDEIHPAESELESFTFDFTIDNASDLTGLRRQVEQLLSRRWEEVVDARRDRP
jgi:dephospho-CoA kinase